MTQSISILICALGGEGGGVLTEWLVETAHYAGFPAQATSVPGVAQRTGATTYYLEIFSTPISQLQDRHPIFGLNPLPGKLDVMISSELLETTRQLSNGMSSAQRTCVITANNRTLTTIEKMQMGDGRLSDAQMMAWVQTNSKTHHIVDFASMAKEAGTIISAVMLGSLGASGQLPFARAHYEKAIQGDNPNASASTQASLRGFDLGWKKIEHQRIQSQYVESILSPAPVPTSTTPTVIAQHFPTSTHQFLSLGYERLIDYQNNAYAQLYVQRMQTVLAFEKQQDPTGTNDFAITRDCARWLALWMAFDDIVRVADLKSRASRWQRVQSEVKAKDDDLLRIYDHFKPGVPEFAALLPTSMANVLMQWDRQRIANGKTPWALPLRIGTHSIIGMMALRSLASLRWLRVWGSRYLHEQQSIEHWLHALQTATTSSWDLGFEVAQCGRLIKGYGSTNERGKSNLLHVLNHLVLNNSQDPAKRTTALAHARQAALKDAGGLALDQALVRHGAPKLPVAEQPIRWMRQPKAIQKP